MKFGRYLTEHRSKLPDEWSKHCIDYNRLKTFLKEECAPHSLQFPQSQPWTVAFADAVEARLGGLQKTSSNFIRELDANVTVLDTFYRQQSDLLVSSHANIHAMSVHAADAVAAPSNVPVVSAFGTTLDDILLSIVRLEKFVFLNFTGIIKILKKHDKITGLKLSTAYLSRLTDLHFYRSTGLSELKMAVMHEVSGVSGVRAGEQMQVQPEDGKNPSMAPLINSPKQGSGAVSSVESQSPLDTPLIVAQAHTETKSWFPPLSVLPSQKIIISMQGPHGTDIMGCLLEKISRYQVLIEDVMISRLHHDVTFAVLTKVISEDVQLFKDLAEGASKWDADLRFQVCDDLERLPKSLDEAPYENRAKYAATVVNQNGLTAPFLDAWTKMLLAYKISVEAIKRLNEGTLCVAEMKLSVPSEVNFDQFRAEVFQLSSSTGTDIALQPDNVYRKSKRLVVLDMDSTLIQQEVIDELAKHAGVVSEVSVTCIHGRVFADD